MTAKLILTILSVVFLTLGGVRVVIDRRVMPASKTWLLIGCIFAAVSVWLWVNS